MAALIAILAVFLVTMYPLLHRELYVLDDIGTGCIPYISWYSDCLAKGENPIWCPYTFCGSYALGEGAIGMYHPFVDGTFRFLPLTGAYWLILMIRFPLLILGMYLFLRRWQLPRDASLLGAATFTFSGFAFMRFNHIGFINLVANIPFLLWATDILLRDPSGRRVHWAWLGVVLLTISELLLGFPQAVYYSAQVELFYVLVLVASRQVGARRVAAWLVAKTLGLVGGAIQIIPTYEEMLLSTRITVSLDFVLGDSLWPNDLLQLIAPYRFPKRSAAGVDYAHEFGLYNGGITTVLSVWAIARIRKLGNARLIASAALILTIYGLLVSLGRYGLLARLQAALPVVGNFRTPARYLLMVHLGMSVLVAVAFADLVRASSDPQRREPWAIWFVAVAVLLTFLRDISWAHIPPYHARPVRLLWVLAGVVLLGGSIMLVAASARGVRFALPLLIVFSVADQSYYSLSYIRRAPTMTLEDYGHSIPMPPDGNKWRVQLWEWDNINIYKHLRSTMGYTPLTPRRRLDYKRPDVRRLAGVGWIAKGNLHFVESRRELTWVPSPDPLPYVRLVGQTVTSERPEQAIEQIDVETTAVVTERLDLPPGPSGSAVLESNRSGHLTIRATAPGDRLLVVAESFHPGWRAFVDGRRVRPLAVYGDFIGCIIPAGSHQVDLIFQPRSLDVGRWLTLGALAATMGIWLAGGYVMSHSFRARAAS